MQDDANKRYSAPKKIGEIMTDIGMGKEDIDYRKPVSKISKKFAKLIFKNLVTYTKYIQKIDIEHIRLAGVIKTMEEFYEEQKNIFNLYTTLIIEKSIEPETINTNVNNTQIKLETFCKITMKVCKDLRKLIDKIPYEHDREIQNKAVDEFIVGFKSECTDIANIIVDQLKLVQQLKKK